MGSRPPHARFRLWLSEDVRSVGAACTDNGQQARGSRQVFLGHTTQPGCRRAAPVRQLEKGAACPPPDVYLNRKGCRVRSPGSKHPGEGPR